MNDTWSLGMDKVIAEVEHRISPKVEVWFPCPVPCTWQDSAGNKHKVYSIHSYYDLLEAGAIKSNHSLYALVFYALRSKEAVTPMQFIDHT